jgi:hypothetical protein
MTIRINGGTLKYMQRANTGNYEHKEAAAEFTFSAPVEGEATEAEITRAGELAIRQVRTMLGLVPNMSLATTATPGLPKPPRVVKSRAEAEAAKAAETPIETSPEPPTAGEVTPGVDEGSLPQVTDKALTEAVGAKAAKYASAEPKREDGPRVIKELIWKFALPQGEPPNQVPGRLPHIPQDQRRAFLLALGELP